MFVDVACVQIQRYLARTPTLRGRRTASAVLAGATGLDPEPDGKPSALLTAVAGLAVPNDQAGVADGVVHLVARDGVDPRQVADTVLGHLRAALPGAVFQAVWGAGPDYLQAYQQQIRPRLDRGEVLVDLPVAAEFPPVSPCRFCRAAAAVTRLPADPFDEHRSQDAGREQDACADCDMRYGRHASRRRGRTAEDRLAAQAGRTRPADLAELAGLGLPGSGGNQLATVYADGNAIGDFFTALGHIPGADKTGVSRRLTQATWDALAAATAAITLDGDGVLCAVPHVVGGDDLLVSVPADRGWRFTRVLLQHLDDAMAAMAAGFGIDTVPSASAGIVFAAADYPFHLVVAAAEQVLRRAKNAVAGRRASIDFQDITQDGHATPDQGPVSLSALARHAVDLDLLAGKLPAHARARQQDLRRHGTDGHLQARADLARTGHADLFAPFPDTPGGPDVIAAAQALRITRWWRHDEP